MRKIKKCIVIVMTVMLCLMQVMPIYAEESNSTEWYEMIEEEFEFTENNDTGVVPYTLYIMDVMTSLAKLGSNKLGLRADVYCASTVQSISIKFYLQKKSGSSWINVSSGTVSASNVSYTAKSMTVSGVTSGTYRAKTVTRVVDKYGYAETVTGYSGALSI